MSVFYSLNQGRSYVHKTCGSITIVSGNDFAGLCNPFSPCLGTISANCGPDSTTNFTWEDTGESVSSFRRRVRRGAIGWTIWNWLIAPIIGAVIGAMAMIAFKGPNMDAGGAATIGGITGVLVMVLFIAPAVTGAIAGKSFYDRK